MLKYTDDLLDAMIEIIQTKRWLQTMVNVIEFQEMLVQGIWVKVRFSSSSSSSFLLLLLPLLLRLLLPLLPLLLLSLLHYHVPI